MFVAALLPALGSAAETPPKPREPVLARAPERAEWSVRMKDVGEDSDPAAKSAMSGGIVMENAVPEARRRVSVDTSKDSRMRTYRLRTRWSDGKSESEWIVAGNHVAERPGGRGFYIVGAEDATAGDLGKTDFPELKWLDISYYRGLKVDAGRKVFVFTVPFDQKPLNATEARLLSLARQTDPTATPKTLFKPKVSEIVVWLDAATQLPIMYNDGAILREYAFEKPPAEPLRPSKEILDFLRARSNYLRAKLATPPGP